MFFFCDLQNFKVFRTWMKNLKIFQWLENFFFLFSNKFIFIFIFFLKKWHGDKNKKYQIINDSDKNFLEIVVVGFKKKEKRRKEEKKWKIHFKIHGLSTFWRKNIWQNNNNNTKLTKTLCDVWGNNEESDKKKKRRSVCCPSARAWKSVTLITLFYLCPSKETNNF